MRHYTTLIGLLIGTCWASHSFSAGQTKTTTAKQPIKTTTPAKQSISTSSKSTSGVKKFEDYTDKELAKKESDLQAVLRNYERAGKNKPKNRYYSSYQKYQNDLALVQNELANRKEPATKTTTSTKRPTAYEYTWVPAFDVFEHSRNTTDNITAKMVTDLFPNLYAYQNRTFKLLGKEIDPSSVLKHYLTVKEWTWNPNSQTFEHYLSSTYNVTAKKIEDESEGKITYNTSQQKFLNTKNNQSIVPLEALLLYLIATKYVSGSLPNDWSWSTATTTTGTATTSNTNVNALDTDPDHWTWDEKNERFNTNQGQMVSAQTICETFPHFFAYDKTKKMFYDPDEPEEKRTAKPTNDVIATYVQISPWKWNSATSTFVHEINNLKNISTTQALRTINNEGELVTFNETTKQFSLKDPVVVLTPQEALSLYMANTAEQY